MDHFRAALNLIMKARLSAKFYYESYPNKTKFHMNSFALDLALIMRFTATQKWPIYRVNLNLPSSHRRCNSFQIPEIFFFCSKSGMDQIVRM